MTRNTKLYRVPVLKGEVVYRTLTVTELTFLDNISNEYYKNENAVRLALMEGSIHDFNFTIINQLGSDIISNSNVIITNTELFNVTVQDFRLRLKNDTWINMILTILGIVPGVTFEYLINLTYTDLVELVCVAERLGNKKLLNIQPTKQPSGPQYIPDSDEGMSLQDKMKADQKQYKDE